MINENKAVKIFENQEFGKIRVIIDPDGKILFCGRDVAKALGYSDLKDAVRKHCKHSVKRLIPHPQSMNKKLAITFIPEGDVYRFIARSRLSIADKFERWISDEVLPSIKKTGHYFSDGFEVPQTFLEALKLATRLEEERLAKVSEWYQNTQTRVQ